MPHIRILCTEEKHSVKKAWAGSTQVPHIRNLCTEEKHSVKKAWADSTVELIASATYKCLVHCREAFGKEDFVWFHCGAHKTPIKKMNSTIYDPVTCDAIITFTPELHL